MWTTLTSSKGLARHRSRSAYFFPVIEQLFDTCLGWTKSITAHPKPHDTSLTSPRRQSFVNRHPASVIQPPTLIPAFVKAMPTRRVRRSSAAVLRRRSAMSWLGFDVHCLLDFGAFGDRERYRDSMCLSVGVGRGRD
jgi:hypothetical protein